MCVCVFVCVCLWVRVCARVGARRIFKSIEERERWTERAGARASAKISETVTMFKTHIMQRAEIPGMLKMLHTHYPVACI